MSFDHLPTEEELLRTYRDSKKADPTSVEYERILVRPKLHLGRACLYTLIAISVIFLLEIVTYLMLGRILYATLVAIAATVAILAIFADRIVIFAVMVYQRLAPDKVRNRCRYEPSCSQYMIMAIRKYGAFKGVRRGVRRWQSCKPPNGGIDYP